MVDVRLPRLMTPDGNHQAQKRFRIVPKFGQENRYDPGHLTEFVSRNKQSKLIGYVCCFSFFA